jgi:hypothetical protein
VAGDAGQHVELGAGIELEIDIACTAGDRQSARQCKRRPAELGRVDPEEQVMHHRIADHRKLEDVADLAPRKVGNLAGERVDRAADRAGHLSIAARVHHHIGDTAHQIFAEADLRVHHSGRCQDLAGRQRAQMRRDRRRADVDGEAEDPVVEPRPDGGDARKPRRQADGARRR